MRSRHAGFCGPVSHLLTSPTPILILLLCPDAAACMARCVRKLTKHQAATVLQLLLSPSSPDQTGTPPHTTTTTPCACGSSSSGGTGISLHPTCHSCRDPAQSCERHQVTGGAICEGCGLRGGEVPGALCEEGTGGGGLAFGFLELHGQQQGVEALLHAVVACGEASPAESESSLCVCNGSEVGWRSHQPLMQPSVPWTVSVLPRRHEGAQERSNHLTSAGKRRPLVPFKCIHQAV